MFVMKTGCVLFEVGTVCSNIYKLDERDDSHSVSLVGVFFTIAPYTVVCYRKDK